MNTLIIKSLIASAAIILLLLPKISFGAVFEVSKLNFAKFTGLSPVESEKCFNEIRVIGDIVEGDIQRLKASLNELTKKNNSIGCQSTKGEKVSISLSSKGGSISEALNLGRLIRGNELSSKIYKNEVCASACVLIFAAGVNKISFGLIQIHRPYFSHLDASLNLKQVQDMRYKVIEEMKKYASEMDFSTALIDEMLAISPENMRTLTSEEITKYRLVGNDASSDEKNVAKRAAFYNITSFEFRRKDAEATEKCNKNINLFAECYQAAMLNISISEVERRIERLIKNCPENSNKENICFKNILVLGK
jgi:hypothetical protein